MESNNEEQYIVYTEHTENRLDRWFYGMYRREDANRVAENLNSCGNDEVTRCVCHISDIYGLGIQHPTERKLWGLFAINCKLDITRVSTHRAKALGIDTSYFQNIPDYVKEAYDAYENEKGEER